MNLIFKQFPDAEEAGLLSYNRITLMCRTIAKHCFIKLLMRRETSPYGVGCNPITANINLSSYVLTNLQ